MDCQMPVVDGMNDAPDSPSGGWKKWPFPPVLIIATTANALPEERQNCLSVGMDDYLSKPYDARDLARALHARVVPDAPLSTSDGKANHSRFAYLAKDIRPEALAGLLAVWEEETPGRVSQIEAMVAEADHYRVRKAAHALKGGSRLLGFQLLSDVCAQLEAEARRPEPNYSDLLATLKEGTRRANALVAEKLQELVLAAGNHTEPLPAKQKATVQTRWSCRRSPEDRARQRSQIQRRLTPPLRFVR